MPQVTRMLGRKPAVVDPRTLRLAKYVDKSALAKTPKSVDWYEKGQPSGMMLNDKIGDCAIAAPGHMMQTWNGCAGGKPLIISDSAILEAYEAVSGYTPTDPSTDIGCAEIDVLNYWKNVGIAGRKISTFASVNIHDHQVVKFGSWVFGGLYIGINLPVSAQTQLDAGKPWDYLGDMLGENAPSSWGGHAVPVVKYDDDGLTVVTWGALQKMTWAFWDAYVEEAFAVISALFMMATNKTPAGFALPEMMDDTALLAMNESSSTAEMA